MFLRFGYAPSVIRRLAAQEPQLVHAHFGPSAPAAATVARSLAVPLIVTFHGRDATMTDDEAARSHRGREYLRARDSLMRDTSLFIAVSDFIRSQLVAAGFPEKRLVTHRNGIDTTAFASGDYPREPVIVFAGRFVEKKGAEFLVRALARLRDAGCDARCVLLGDGPLRTSLEDLARRLRVRAEFFGFRPLEEVRAWLRRATVVAVPSITARDGDSEGLPTVLLEAQASGTPVVATRHSGIPEGVIENETAILVDEGDEAALSTGLGRFLEDSESVSQFGRRGRAFVQSAFELRKQVSGLEDLYDRVVDDFRSRKKVAS
jgi:glycosyltransferase involved in cell wall biosynthesis